MAKVNLNVPADAQKELDATIGKYRSIGITIDILEATSKSFKVRVKQIRMDTDRILTNKELFERASKAMDHLKTYYKEIH